MTDMYKGHEVTVMRHDFTAKVRCLRCDQATEISDLDLPRMIEAGSDETLVPWVGEPCPNCPTCQGPGRETVGMVCETCGTDYGPDLVAGLDDLTPAESLGVLVTQAIAQAQEEAKEAQDGAQEARVLMAGAIGHLHRVLGLLENMGTTFAADTRIVTEAKDYLDGLESEQTPEAGETQDGTTQ